jgi:hypothetical protein
LIPELVSGNRLIVLEKLSLKGDWFSCLEVVCDATWFSWASGQKGEESAGVRFAGQF